MTTPYYAQVPTYESKLVKDGNITIVWYRFFQAVNDGTPSGGEVPVTLTASPFTFTAPSHGFVILRGGVVSAVQFIRTVTTLTGQTAGIFPLSRNDQLIVTYTGLPAMLFVPQ